MSITALIAEDEPVLARALASALAVAWPELRIVATVHDGDAAARALQDQPPDVAFLDIRMPGRSGLQAAAAAAPSTLVVFVTAYDQYALEAFDKAAVDYVLKPVGEERIARCVERLKRRLADRNGRHADASAARVDGAQDDAAQEPHDGSRETPHGQAQDEAQDHGRAAAAGQASRGFAAIDPALLQQLGALLEQRPTYLRFLRASLGDTIRQIPIDEVLYLEAQDKYVNVVTADGQSLIRVSLSELSQQLDPQRFTQIHRSTLVNLDAIESIRRDFAGRLFVHLRGRSDRLPVSRQYAAQFKGM